MPGIPGQPTPSPQDLQSPVPQTAADPFAQFAIPEIEGTSSGGGFQRGPASEPAADPFAQYSVDAPVPVQAAPADQQVQDEQMSPLPAPTGWDSAKEQMREVTARFRNSFAVTDTESVDFLKSTGLFEQVKKTDDGVLVKRPGRKGWEKFDRDKIELLGDTVDGARTAFEAIIENGMRIGGGTLGFMKGGAAGAMAGLAAGPGSILASPAGAAAAGALASVPAASVAGAAGAATALKAGDWAQSKLLTDKDGNPIEDPNRDKTQEAIMAAGIGATFNFVSSKMARRAAARAAAGKEAKRTIDYATQKAADAIEDINDVRNSTIKLASDFKLDPQQLTHIDKGVPELNDMAQALSTAPSFRAAREKAAKGLTDAFDSMANMIWARNGRSGAKVAEDFVITSKDVRNIEGQMVKTFKTQAAEQLGGAKIQVNRFMPVVNQLMQMAEGKNGLGKLEYELNLQPNKAKTFAKELKVWGEYLNRTKGQMGVDSAFKIQDRLTEIINANINSDRGRPLATQLIKLRNAVRDDAIDGMDVAFEMMGGDKGKQLSSAFKASKDRYRQIVQATEGLGGILDKDHFSRDHMIKTLFEGSGSYSKAMNAKTLIQESNPGLWAQMTGEYFTRLRKEATNRTGDVDWFGMSKKFGSMDERLQKEMLDQVGVKPEQMKALFNIGQRMQNATIDNLANTPKGGVFGSWIKRAIVLMPGTGTGNTAKAQAVKEMIEGMGKDQAVAKWLKDGGMEEVLRDMPGISVDKRSALRTWIDSWTPSVVRTAKTPVRRNVQDE